MRTTVTTLLLLLVTVARGQVVWPGDVNNNGIVNHIDALYWAVAKEATGPARQDATTDWSGQPVTTAWGQNFPNGVNYAFADCDGDGIVTDDDKAIIEENYGLEHDTVIPEEFLQGDPAEDPILALSSDMEDVAPGETWNVRLSLENPGGDTIHNFYGIAFTVHYNPDVIGNQASNFRLNIDETSWLYGIGGNQVIQYVHNDPVNGIAHITVARMNQQETSGIGLIGTFSIVIEDIIIGLSSADLSVTDIKMVDLGLTESPVAPSSLHADVVTSFTDVRDPAGVFRVYPNPVVNDILIIEAVQSEKVQQVELYNALGRKVLNQTFRKGEEQQMIEMGHFPSGIYLLKIRTERFIYIQKISR